MWLHRWRGCCIVAVGGAAGAGGCLRLAEALALIAGQAGQELLAGLP